MKANSTLVERGRPIFRRSEETKTRPSGTGGHIVDYFGEPFGRPAGPQGFLVRMPVQTTVQAHFHPVDQFHVFFGAEGSWYKRSTLGPLVVHYTDAYVTYGPFGTDAVPMDFFSLRPAKSEFAAFMPQDRDRLVPTNRHRNLRLNLSQDLAELNSVTAGVQAVASLGPEEDGLAVWIYGVDEGQELSIDLPERARGQYILVLAGFGSHGSQVLEKGCVGWRDSEHPEPTLITGTSPTPMQLLVLQFPTAGV